MQMAASSLTASSGGSHSGKMYLTLYTAKERDTIATVHGLMIIDSTYSLMKARKPPKVSMT